MQCSVFFKKYDAQGAIAQQAQQQLSGMENWFITKTSESYLRAYQDQREQLVYLTADSPEELSELHPTRKYIIGGIVDRNRHKNICFRKAEAQVGQAVSSCLALFKAS